MRITNARIKSSITLIEKHSFTIAGTLKHIVLFAGATLRIMKKTGGKIIAIILTNRHNGKQVEVPEDINVINDF